MSRLITVSWILLAILAAGPVAAAVNGNEAHDEPVETSVFAGSVAQSVAAALVFLVLMTILYKKAWGPILSGLQDRESKIRQDLLDAEAAAAKAGETLKQYESKLADAQAEAQKIIDRSRSDALRHAHQLEEDAQQQIQLMRQRAEGDITAAKVQALSEIYEEVATISTSVAGRILQRQINPEDQQRLVEESLKQLKA